jgi:hypothetical protein
MTATFTIDLPCHPGLEIGPTGIKAARLWRRQRMGGDGKERLMHEDFYRRKLPGILGRRPGDADKPGAQTR